MTDGRPPRTLAGQTIVALTLLAAGCASSPGGKPGAPPQSALPPLHDSGKVSSVQIRQVCDGSSTASDDPRLLAGDGSRSPCVQAPSSDEDVRVEIDAVVDPEGRVTRARVVRSHPRCDAPCLASVHQQRFEPSRKAGRATFGSAMLVCRWGAAVGRAGECT